MRLAELEHIIRAAATIADDDELIVVGSQAILAQFPDAPDEMLRSNEADIYPKNQPERWELIDGAIGELSTFHDTFGYYAQGVQEGVATLPEGWQKRLIALRTPGRAPPWTDPHVNASPRSSRATFGDRRAGRYCATLRSAVDR